MATSEQILSLKQRYAQINGLEFELCNGLFPVIHIQNQSASASISLYGGHIMSYQPKGSAPVLWLSKAAKIETGQSIRGGIPVCWPWFGANPYNKGMPIHGFARISPWSLEEAVSIDANTTELTLNLTNNDINSFGDVQPFLARLFVTVGNTLEVVLRVINTGPSQLEYTAGLHTYFNISDINNISIKKLEGFRYFSRPDNEEDIQNGKLNFSGPIDRIYHGATCAEIVDPGFKRIITVKNSLDSSIVIWNPGEGVERRFSGFASGDERTMLCLEAARTSQETVTLSPDSHHELSTKIQIQHII